MNVRLGQSSEGSLVVLLYGAILVSSLIVGILAGPWLSSRSVWRFSLRAFP